MDLAPAMAAGGAAAGHTQGLCGERGSQWPAHPHEESTTARGQDSSDAHFGAEALRWLDAVVREVGALPGARQVRLGPAESLSVHVENLLVRAETPHSAGLRNCAAQLHESAFDRS